MVANVLDGIEVRLCVDYLAHKTELHAQAEKVVCTGPIDAYFGYELGGAGISFCAVRDGSDGQTELPRERGGELYRPGEAMDADR